MKLGDRTCWEYRHHTFLGDANVSERGGRDGGESEQGRGGGRGRGCVCPISLAPSRAAAVRREMDGYVDGSQMYCERW